MATSPSNSRIHTTGEATGFIPVTTGDDRDLKPITVIGTEPIRGTFDEATIRQATTCRTAPGVTEVVLNPDAHVGYGAPIGCVMVSPSHIYPGPVGVDIKCSMSLLQLDIPEVELRDKRVRRALIEAITERTPTGPGRGSRSVKKGQRVAAALGQEILTRGAAPDILAELGIPEHWATRCEDATHTGHNGQTAALQKRLDIHLTQHGWANTFGEKVNQLGSYGGGNHFGEAEIVQVQDSDRARSVAKAFGLRDGHVAFLSHCGSRGFGAKLAELQFRTLKQKFAEWDIPLPGNDGHMVYAPLGTPEANDYIDDMHLGANFATVNHMLINKLVLDAFREVIPGCTGELVYFISHNIARQELIDGKMAWVHRKGATRAFPAGHPGLQGSPFADIGHPILLPGNPADGSSVMVADAGAKLSCYSVNHGAGRRMGRKNAARTLDQARIDKQFADLDILTNCRQYPIDEAPAAYKDFEEVLSSVKLAGLATEVAKLKARFVIKDGSEADD